MSIDIPVIMYHTVGVVEPRWRWNFLTVPWTVFENQLKFLRSAGYSAITFDELYAYRIGKGTLPHRPVLFTFDDGYLDNWVYACPLLKKYGFHGTVFVNPEFIDPCTECRPTLDDVWNGRLQLGDLPSLGFLSWEELRAMEASGVMKTQSHAMTHTWYPSGPNIVDFRHPGDDYIWMDWNSAVGNKWDYLREGAQATIRYGEPVYENNKSLAGRRFYPDLRLADHLVGFVGSAGNDFFKHPDWKNELFREIERYRSSAQLVERFETEEEFLARLEWELGEAKRIIGEKLGKKVEYLCWPGGGYGKEAVQLASRYYLASTISSQDRGVAGFDEEGHLRIRRIGVPCIENGSAVHYPGGRYLHYYIQENQGSKVHRFLRQWLKLLALVNHR